MDRTERINIRCTPEEKQLLLERAAKVGLTLSGFMIWEALGEELGQKIVDRKEKKKKAK